MKRARSGRTGSHRAVLAIVFALSPCACDPEPPDLPGVDAAIVHVTGRDAAVAFPDAGIEIDAGVSPAGPSIDVQPGRIDFGVVAIGAFREFLLPIANVGTGAPLHLTREPVLAQAGDGFSIAWPQAQSWEQEIASGHRAQVAVIFAPKRAGDEGAILEIHSDDAQHPVVTVRLTGSALHACVLVAPSALDFGTFAANCTSRDRSFTLYNVCEANLVIASIEFGAGTSSEFHIVQKPTIPYALAPGTCVDFKVKFAPTVAGDELGTVVVTFAQLVEPAVLRMVGHGIGADTYQTDVFAQDPQPKLDVLFVIDNSGSMADKQANLAANLDAFFSALESMSFDFHLAVTTTGVDIAHGGASDNVSPPDDNGCFVPASPGGPTFVTSQTPNARQAFLQSADVGTVGNPNEFLLRPVYLAFTEPNLSGCNAGFLRDNANLSVVVVTDTADKDTVPVSAYLSAFFGVKGALRKYMFSLSAIAPREQTGTNCADAADAFANDRLDQAVTATAGLDGDICDEGWASSISKWGTTCFGYRIRFFLSNVPYLPAESGLMVQVDGADCPAVSPSGVKRWSYNATANAIDFELLAAPEPGSTLTVSYLVACMH